MTTEEKAKAYDEALERAKEINNEQRAQPFNVMTRVFPELKESNDERIRKEIISFLEGFYANRNKDRWIAWLEKQGEYANFRNKIQVGDEVTRNQDGLLVNLSRLNRVAEKRGEKQAKQKQKHFELKAGHWYICHRAFCCRADHLTVKEGERFMCEKDGVVKGFLVKEPEKYFKEVCAPAPIEDEQKPDDKVEPKFKVGDIIRHKKRGFTCKIIAVDTEYRLSECNGTHLPFESQDAYELVEQKPAWSEEDERWYNELELMALYFSEDVLYRKRFFDWIKSIKDRVQPQPQREWSEGVERLIEEAAECLRKYASKVQGGNSKVYVLSLADRIESFRPQTTWKPSEEQIEALMHMRFAVEKFGPSASLAALDSLYNDLKKLM